MAVLTNSTALSYAIEESVGVLPVAPVFTTLEPNDIGTFGASITTVARNPISQDRMAKKGAITDLDSAFDFDSDLTLAAFNNFIEGFIFSVWKEQVSAEPTGVTGGVGVSNFAHATLSTTLAEDTLLYSREFINTENNGLLIVNAGSTDTVTEVKETLITETPGDGAKFDVAGFQGAAGDLEIDAEDNLVSAGAFDFTTDANIQVGQFIYIGGGTVQTSFPTAGDGTARVRAISATKLTLDKSELVTGADPGVGTETVQIFIGSFIRNVPLNSADFLNRTYQFEAAYNGLDINGNGQEDEKGYEYAIGNQANQMTVNMPLADKATVGWAFIGTDQEPATGTQKWPLDANRAITYDTDAMNTTSDFVKISLTKNVDGSPLAAYFKDLTLTIGNNVSPEKILGNLGAHNMNIGDFTVTGSTEALFTGIDVINAVRDNETVSLDWNIENDDGALHFDLPSMTLGNAGKTFPRNETVKITIDGNAFKDNYFGYVISCTKFSYIPVVG
jgi:hypothetical protein